ncbi:unnamed protein product [Spirodela intermedia]|uniref:Uncharacterized protein n=1 Tax=Spirodela intermedia TaxID=51605 RepID=A0A7I8L6S3_SPIIN|nr:unnamed protein product [Spirodela intermedia]
MKKYELSLSHETLPQHLDVWPESTSPADVDAVTSATTTCPALLSSTAASITDRSWVSAKGRCSCGAIWAPSLSSSLSLRNIRRRKHRRRTSRGGPTT